MYEELRENEDAGSLDTWPTPQEADDQVAAATSDGAIDRIGIDRIRGPGSIDPVNPVTTNKVERILAVDGIVDGDSHQPRSALAAIIRLQSTEIERLALENDRLAARRDAVHQLHEDTQTQCRDLERQLRATSAGNQPPAPAFDIEEMRRAAREGMSAEIKPVLVAILDLLESTLPGGTEAETPTAVVAGAPVSIPVSLAAEVMNDFHRLPEILTRPIEELLSDRGKAGSPRHQAQRSVMPSAFAWTNLIS
ncbi:MAG: hypothetical protein V3S27_01860 [Kiloniellales bacterium]